MVVYLQEVGELSLTSVDQLVNLILQLALLYVIIRVVPLRQTSLPLSVLHQDIMDLKRSKIQYITQSHSIQAQRHQSLRTTITTINKIRDVMW